MSVAHAAYIIIISLFSAVNVKMNYT